GLHSIGAVVEDAGDQNVGGIAGGSDGIVHAGVAVLGEADLDIGRAGAADENAEIRGEQDVGVAAGGEAGFDGPVVHGDHQPRNFAGGDAGVLGEIDRGGGAHAQHAAKRQIDLGGFGTGSDGAAYGDDCLALGDLECAGDFGCPIGVLAVERDDGDGGCGGRLVGFLGGKRGRE